MASDAERDGDYILETGMAENMLSLAQDWHRIAVVVTESDTVFPPDIVEETLEATPGASDTILMVPGDHLNVSDDPQCAQSAVEALDWLGNLPLMRNELK